MQSVALALHELAVTGLNAIVGIVYPWGRTWKGLAFGETADPRESMVNELLPVATNHNIYYLQIVPTPPLQIQMALSGHHKWMIG